MISQQLLLLLIRQQSKIASKKLCLGLLNEDERELVAIATEEVPFLTVSDIEDFLLCSPPDFAEIIIIDSLQFIAKSKKDQVGKILNKRVFINGVDYVFPVCFCRKSGFGIL